MKNRNSKPKSKVVAQAKAGQSPVTAVVQSDCPPPAAFLEEAKKEPKRILLMDYIVTINTLRNEKNFTFRAIAEWFAERGIETDHSAVYRTFLAAVPAQDRNPYEDWPEEIDEPGFGDENVTVKRP